MLANTKMAHGVQPGLLAAEMNVMKCVMLPAVVKEHGSMLDIKVIHIRLDRLYRMYV